MNRRDLIRATATLSMGVAAGSTLGASGATGTMRSVEQWGMLELRFNGPSGGNPFIDVQLTAVFAQENRQVPVFGFYDGEGIYRIRYMPDAPGRWTYVTASNAPELNGATGAFEVLPPTKGNHGPVQVANRFHFAHVDGTPYFPFGTTCYALGFIGEPFAQQTFDGLVSAQFNKVRLCLLPKPLGDLQPVAMPFERIPGAVIADPATLADGGMSTQKFDTTRFNPAYFRHFEKIVERLNVLGIQADVILFHPYDAWDFRNMPADRDDRYLRYAIARLSAYRNVWWSVANEYDFLTSKTLADWNRFFRIITECDPSSHLRSIHHSGEIYDNARPWVTHASLQRHDFERSSFYRESWGKPVIFDEVEYEGDFAKRWGNLSAEELVRRFWLAVVHGAYASHGETFITPPGQPVWSNAGKLRGSSGPRIRFLRELVERITKSGLNEFEGAYYPCAGKKGEVYLYYFDYHCPAEYDFPLPVGIRFRASLIAPYDMTIERMAGSFTGKDRGADSRQRDSAGLGEGICRIRLPGKPYMAVLFERE